MSRVMVRGVCADCGKTRGIYNRTLGICRTCNDTRRVRRVRRPNGPLPVTADSPRPVCGCGRAALPAEGLCLKHWQQAERPPPYDPVYEGQT